MDGLGPKDGTLPLDGAVAAPAEYPPQAQRGNPESLSAHNRLPADAVPSAHLAALPAHPASALRGEPASDHLDEMASWAIRRLRHPPPQYAFSGLQAARPKHHEPSSAPACRNSRVYLRIYQTLPAYQNGRACRRDAPSCRVSQRDAAASRSPSACRLPCPSKHRALTAWAEPLQSPHRVRELSGGHLWQAHPFYQIPLCQTAPAAQPRAQAAQQRARGGASASAYLRP